MEATDKPDIDDDVKDDDNEDDNGADRQWTYDVVWKQWFSVKSMAKINLSLKV